MPYPVYVLLGCWRFFFGGLHAPMGSQLVRAGKHFRDGNLVLFELLWILLGFRCNLHAFAQHCLFWLDNEPTLPIVTYSVNTPYVQPQPIRQ